MAAPQKTASKITSTNFKTGDIDMEMLDDLVDEEETESKRMQRRLLKA